MIFFQLDRVVAQQNVGEESILLHGDPALTVSALRIYDGGDDNTFNIFSTYDNTLREQNDGTTNANFSLKDKLQHELHQYKEINFDLDPQSTDIINWWKLHAEKFPLLSRAARFVFSVPASSSATENNFSIAGFIFSDRRTNMKPEKLENLLILRSNRDLHDRNDITLNSNDENGDESDDDYEEFEEI